jgi:hypothetical protein
MQATMIKLPIFAVAGIILASVFLNSHRGFVKDPPRNVRETCDHLLDRSLCQAGSLIAQYRAGSAPIVPLANILPDPAKTPGAINPAITQNNIDSTICIPAYVASLTASPSTTASVAHRLVDRDYPGQSPSLYQVDQLVPLSLGGARDDTRNLWLQTWTGPQSAAQKDKVETFLNDMVCKGRISLTIAQRVIARNWVVATQGLRSLMLAIPQFDQPARVTAPVTLLGETVESTATEAPYDAHSVVLLPATIPNQQEYEVPALMPDR